MRGLRGGDGIRVQDVSQNGAAGGRNAFEGPLSDTNIPDPLFPDLVEGLLVARIRIPDYAERCVVGQRVFQTFRACLRAISDDRHAATRHVAGITAAAGTPSAPAPDFWPACV